MTDNLAFHGLHDEHIGSGGNSKPLTMATGSGPLKQAEVYKLRDHYGLNTVETGRRRSWYQILLTALVHPFNILLMLLAITSGVTQEFETMGIMFFMVFISTVLRFHQEWKSQVAAESLLQFVATKVLVIRKDPVQYKDVEAQVPSIDLVPGDWIRLFPGDLIPGDVEIIEAKDFHVSQAALTGEAIPIQKYVSHRDSREYQQNQNQNQFETVNLDDQIPITGKKKKDRSKKKHFSKAKLSPFSRCCKNILGLPVYDTSSSADLESGSMESDLDRPELCFMGSAVVSGTALCRVTTTGSHTHFGKMAVELAKRRPQNAFQLGVRRISWIFFITMICLVPPVLILQGLIVKDWYAAFTFALAVAVGLTPEMLPMIVNTTLAKGAVEMSKKHCIIKQLDSIINMGGIDILCTDKTGTLTKSIVTLNKFVNIQGVSSPVPLFMGYLNSFFQSVQQNPIDSAVVTFFDQAVLQSSTGTPSLLRRNSRQSTSPIKSSIGFPMVSSNITSKFELIDELPFDFVRRRMSVVLREVERTDSGTVLICKGAVEEVLGLCTRIINCDERTNVYSVIRNDDVETNEMTEGIHTELLSLNEKLSEDGLRVIAVAYKTIQSRPSSGVEREGSISSFCTDDERELTFAGFLAFLDPPKDDSKEAIKNLLEHNVKVKVLTGDSPLVCKKICKEIGLEAEKVVTGADMAQLGSKSPETLARLVEEATIFAKLTPLQKSDIVRALKKNGHIVGFLGDGINDAPALTEADVGISVDSGTDICKESADIILLEKDLTVVVDAVVTGRMTYGNTLKYIVMAVSSNFGNVFSILTASAWLSFEPMAPFHILTQNLLYDISQIAIPWDNMDQEFLRVPHRWSMKSVLKFMVMIGPWSSVFDITTFLYMYYYFGIQTTEPIEKVREFQTAWFTVGLLTQTLIVHMIRTPKIPFFQSRASLPVITMTMIIMGVGLSLPYIPGLNSWLRMVHLQWEFYPFLVAVLLAYCCAAQLAKVIYIKLFKEWY